MSGGWEATGRIAAKTPGGLEDIKVTQILLPMSRTLSGSLPVSYLGCLLCRFPNQPTGTVDALRTSPAHTSPPVQGQLLVHASSDTETELLQIANDHSQKASPTAELEACKQMSIHHFPRESKQTGGCLHLAWLCWIERKHTILRVPSMREEGMWSRHIHIKMLENASKSLTSLMKHISLPNTSQQRPEKFTASSNVKTSMQDFK